MAGSRKLRIAAVQMDATPEETSVRLERAAALVAEAASSGAQLVVLPELFNTGYRYSDDNYARSETQDGQTARWMKAAAAEHQVHLAGTFLLQDGTEVYNSALLVAPDGRTWRYDKSYPWAWERAYFRAGRGTATVADTELGKLGLMICWDYAHPELWQRYAGRVDVMVMMSCPPRITEAKVVFSEDEVFATNPPPTYTGTDEPFGTDLDAQAAWLGVPLVNTTGSGWFSSGVPSPYLSLLSTSVGQPALLSRLFQARSARLEAGYYRQTKVVNGDGTVAARVSTDGDGFVLAEVALADTIPQPRSQQPAQSYGPLAYLLSDLLLPALTGFAYRRGYRRALGRHMAPLDPATLQRWTLVAALFAAGYVFARITRRR